MIYSKVVKLMNLLLIAGAIVIVSSVSFDFFNNLSLKNGGFWSYELQLIVCLIFIVDYFLRLFKAENKKRFFWRNIIILLISIPYINILTMAKVDLSQEMSTIVRILPVIRGGYTVALLLNHATKNFISTLITSYIASVVFICYFASMIFYYSEVDVNPDLHGYGDALWWTFMNLTTVGSNIYAVTPLGKVLSVVVAATGMMMFPIFTAYITELFQLYHDTKVHDKKL